MPLTNDAVPLNHLVSETDSLVTLELEFTVADTVIPTAGVFTVKLAKNKHSNLGITIQGRYIWGTYLLINYSWGISFRRRYNGAHAAL